MKKVGSYFIRSLKLMIGGENGSGWESTLITYIRAFSEPFVVERRKSCRLLRIAFYNGKFHLHIPRLWTFDVTEDMRGNYFFPRVGIANVPLPDK